MPDARIVGAPIVYNAGNTVPMLQTPFRGQRRIKRLQLYFHGQVAANGGTIVPAGIDSPLPLIRAIRVMRGGTPWIRATPQSLYRREMWLTGAPGPILSAAPTTGVTLPFFANLEISLEDIGPKRTKFLDSSGWDTSADPDISVEIDFAPITAYGTNVATVVGTVEIAAIVDTNANNLRGAALKNYKLFQPQLMEDIIAANTVNPRFAVDVSYGAYVSDIFMLAEDQALAGQLQLVDGLVRQFGIVSGGARQVVGQGSHWPAVQYEAWNLYQVAVANRQAGLLAINQERNGNGPLEWLPVFGQNSVLQFLFDTATAPDAQIAAVVADANTFLRIMPSRWLPNQPQLQALQAAGLI